jgi:hypothetical protein
MARADPVGPMTGTSCETWWVETPCRDRLNDNNKPCEVEHWIRTDGLPTGFLTCERHLGTAGYITWPALTP